MAKHDSKVQKLQADIIESRNDDFAAIEVRKGLKGSDLFNNSDPLSFIQRHDLNDAVGSGFNVLKPWDGLPAGLNEYRTHPIEGIEYLWWNHSVIGNIEEPSFTAGNSWQVIGITKDDIPEGAPVTSVNGRIGDVTGLAEQVDLIQETESRELSDEDLQNQINEKANSSDILSNLVITYDDLDAITHQKYVNPNFANQTVILQTLVAGGYGGIYDGLSFSEFGELTIPFTTDPQFKGIIQGVAGVLGNYLAKTDVLTANSKNIFNKNGVFIDGQIDSVTGDIIPVEDFVTSYPISVSEGSYHGEATGAVLNTMRRIARFNELMQLIPDESGNAGSTDVSFSAEVKHVKISVHISALNTFQFEEGTEKTPYVAFSVYLDKLLNYPIKASILKDGATIETVGNESNSVLNKGYLGTAGYKTAQEITLLTYNLFNNITPDQVGNVNRYISTTTGAISTSPGWKKTGKIRLSEDETEITISNEIDFPSGRSYRFTDSTGAVLEFGNIIDNPAVLQFPVGALDFDMTVIKNGEDNLYEKLVINYGNEAKPYAPFGGLTTANKINENPISSSYLIDDENNLFSANDFVKKGEVISSGEISLTIDESERSEINYMFSGRHVRQVFRSNRPYVVDKSNVFDWVATFIDGVLIHNMSDEAAPYRVTGATIGANHGYNKTVIPAISHGKTNVDVGSVWLGGATQFVIVNIPDNDSIEVSAKQGNGNLLSDTLTHVSGATNTAPINSTVRTNGVQMYPVFNNRVLDIYVDDHKVAGAGEFKAAENVTYSESYDILDKDSIIAWFITQVGTPTKIIEVQGTPIMRINNTYVFDKEMGCVMYQSFIGLDELERPFQDIMFNMNNPIQPIPLRKVYIPKSLPFTHETIDYNFNIPTEITDTLTSRINFTPSRCESEGVYCDRRIELTDNLGYAIGFLPVLDASLDVRRSNASNKALQISETEKTYMSAIDSLAIDTFSKGDSYAVVGYKKYFFLPQSRTAEYYINSKFGKYGYLDWHSDGIDTIELPEYLVGIGLEIIDKTDNVTVLNKFLTKQLTVNVEIDGITNKYGCMILKFN